MYLCTNVLVRVKTNMIRKIFRVGHSVCVTLDKKMLKDLGMDGTTYVWVEPDKKGESIIIRKRKNNEW